MFKLNPIVVTLGLILLTGCSRSFHVAKIVPGKTSVDEALHRLDRPLVSKKSAFDQAVDVHVWEDVTIEARQGMVTGLHRAPASHEKTLQFWKQQYQNLPTTFTPLSDNQVGEDHWQFNIPGQGVSVIYQQRIDQVVRVIYYEVR